MSKLTLTFSEDNVSFNKTASINNKRTKFNESVKVDTIIEFILQKNNLVSFPQTFGNLTNLEILDLQDNQLVSLPETFGNLTNLRILDLQDNQLVSLPETFGNLTNLRILNLQDNQLVSLPETFGNLTNLVYLNLSQQTNQTHSVPIGIPIQIGNLENLKQFVLDNSIILFPLQENYIFTNPIILNALRKVFDIEYYNTLMIEKTKNQNLSERIPTGQLTEGMKKFFKDKGNSSATANNTATRVLFNTRLTRNILSNLGTTYTPQDVDDVIKSHGGMRKKFKTKKRGKLFYRTLKKNKSK